MLRNLSRNFTYSAINIAGLATGITASVFIFLWVHHEHSYDKYHPDYERIYRVINTIDVGGTSSVIDVSPSRLALAVKVLPEIESTAVVFGGGITGIKVNNETFSVAGKICYVDQAWFEMFDYSLLEGSFSAFGEHP